MLEKFYADVLTSGSILQLGTVDKILGTFSAPDGLFDLLEANESRDMFFLAGVQPTRKFDRATDADVKAKNHIYFDIDVRKSLAFDATDEELKELARQQIIPKLSDSRFKNWRYIVFTGNGLHVYFFSEEPVEIKDRDAWRTGMAKLVDEMSAVIGILVDRQCINISRIARAPGSFNNKNPDNPKRVEIIASQDVFSNMLSFVEDAGIQEMIKADDAAEKSAIQFSIASPLTADNFQSINENIPISSLVQKLFGWETNGRNFWDAKDKKYKGCFVPPESNVLMHGGTDHIRAAFPAFSCFNLVKTKFDFTDSQTFSWFRENFPQAFIENLSALDGNTTEKMRKIRIAKKMQSLLLPDDFKHLRLLVRGAVTRIGGTSKTGKSTFAYFLAHSLIVNGAKGIVFSTEVPCERVYASLARIETGIPSWDFMGGVAEFPADFDSKFRRLSVYDVMETKNSLLEIERILKAAISLTPNDPPTFIIVDFCQMVQSKKNFSTESMNMWQYAQEIQKVAQENNVAIVDLSQLAYAEEAQISADRNGTIPFEQSRMLFSVADIAAILRRPGTRDAINMKMQLDVRKHKYLEPLPEIMYLDFDIVHGTYSKAEIPLMHDKSILK